VGASCVAVAGGNWNNGSYAGAFRLDANFSAAANPADFGARLMFL
jgi:hypothetical protein